MAEASLTLGVMDSIMEVFMDVLNGGTLTLRPSAMRLARQLATVEVVFVSAGLFFARAEALQRMLWASLYIGFFAILLFNLPTFARAFMDASVNAGLLVGGGKMTTAQFFTPSLVVSQGTKLTGPLVKHIEDLKGKWSSLTNFIPLQSYAFMLQFCWFCWILQACHILIATIEFGIIVIKAFFLVPWGLFSRTAFMAEGAIGGVISSAVRLGVLALVVSITWKALTHPRMTLAAATADPSWNTVLAHVALALALLVINWVAPNYAASLSGSGPAITGQAIIHTVAAGAGLAAAGVRAGMGAVRQVGAPRRPTS